MDEGVKKYIEKQKSPQKEIIEKLRKIILKTFPQIKEEMKLGVPWYEGKYYIVALKDHVNLGFSLKGLSKKEAVQQSKIGRKRKAYNALNPKRRSIFGVKINCETASKEKELFEGGGKTMKHIEISSLKELDGKKIVKLLQLVKKE